MHYNDLIWVLDTLQPFVQWFGPANKQEMIKFRITKIFGRESTADRWFPLTKVLYVESVSMPLRHHG